MSLESAIKEGFRMVRMRMVSMITRAVVTAVNDQNAVQELNALVDVDVKRTEVERFQNYGFTSKPKPGAEAVVLSMNAGKGDHLIAVAVEDHRYRVTELEDGEVCVYDHTGTKIHLKANGDVEITPSSGVLKVAGDLEVSGDVSSDGDVTAGAISLKNHTHGAGTLTYVNAAGAVTPVSGATGGPS